MLLALDEGRILVAVDMGADFPVAVEKRTDFPVALDKM